MTKLDLPFFSQYAQEVPEEWRRRACGITSLRMAIAYLLRGSDRDMPGIAHLIKETEVIFGWTEYGIDHEAVIRLAHNYGLAAYREEFRSILVNVENKTFSAGPHAGVLAAYGLTKLRRALSEGMVPLISITVDGKRDSHIVPLTGFSEEGWYYHDPEATDEKTGGNLFLPHDDFELRFRGLAIFIGPAA